MSGGKTWKWIAAAILIPALVSGWGALRSTAAPSSPAYPFILLPDSAISNIDLEIVGTTTEIVIPFSTTVERIRSGSLEPIPVSPQPWASPVSASGEVTCRQLLLNPQLDVLELGDGTGRAEPWVVYDPIVYYSTQDYVSAQYSFVLVDADSDDPTPEQDAFAQALYMPTNLVTVTVEYYAATVNTNSDDGALGNLWIVDSNGEPVTFVGGWQVADSPNAWQKQQAVLTDPNALASIAGRQIGIFLFNDTDGATPGERVYFDDITLTACSRAVPSAAAVYLPAVMRNFRSGGSACIPPSESPQDTWNANRGYVECNATCQSTLSRLDQADYYTFVPSFTGIGNCTLYLENLPAGTEWAAMIFVDQPNYPPPYAPGPVNGQCRIATPGSGNKSVTCPLTGGTPYFIKVSAGGSYTGPEGRYTMRVTCPDGTSPGPTPTPPTGWTVITSMDFEGAFPGAWRVLDGRSGYGEYYWNKRDCRRYAGSYSGWAVGGGANGSALSCGSNYPNYAASLMIYGPFSLEGATAAEMRFQLWAKTEVDYDTVCWAASVDGSNFYGPCLSGTADWHERVLNFASVPTLGNLLGRSAVWVLLAFFSDSSVNNPEGAYVDNIILRKCMQASCGGAAGSEAETSQPPEGEWSVRSPVKIVVSGSAEAPEVTIGLIEE